MGSLKTLKFQHCLTEAQWDLTWDTDKAEFMRKQHPHAQFEYFEKSGHCIFCDEQEKFFMLLKNFLESSSKMHISYKPGNRLAWPKSLPPFMQLLAVKGGPYADYYQQALNENVKDPWFWAHVAEEYINAKKEYAKCLTSLQKIEDDMRVKALKTGVNWGIVLQRGRAICSTCWVIASKPYRNIKRLYKLVVINEIIFSLLIL